jgi:2-methylisocitrate lyase-like PEP mutase family enzyme
MSGAASAAARFRALHEVPGEVLVLANAWDAVSARMVEACGGKAVATSSAAVAWAAGAADGERLPVERVLSSARAMVGAVRVPVSVDFEAGYSSKPEEVAAAVLRLSEIGVAGVNLEDGTGPVELLAEKVAACKLALGSAGRDVFVNARTDVVLRRLAAQENAIDEVIRRARVYVEAGCDGVFVPGVAKAEELTRIVEAVRVPLNVWAAPALPAMAELLAIGVRRVSVGPKIALAALSAARREARRVLEGTWGGGGEGETMTYPEVNQWFASPAPAGGSG